MSPIGGVGINLAVQDAVAAANVLADPLYEKRDVTPLLAEGAGAPRVSHAGDAAPAAGDAE